jgi:hypothetical protein
MPQPSSLDVLNRLLRIVFRSLPMYLVNTSPWIARDDGRAEAVLHQIVADAKHYAQKIADAILDRNGVLEHGSFPIEFADVHDLSLDYLIVDLIDAQRRDIAAIEQCVKLLEQDRASKALAEEVLGNARGHLEALDELNKLPAA